MVKSHEYISKTILRNFSFSDGGNKRAVKYIKLPQTRIHHGDIKIFNTRLGAYTDENENIMSSEFETYLGDLSVKVRKELRTTHTLHAPDFNLDIIKKYFMYQCWRDDTFIQEIMYDIERYFESPSAKALKNFNQKDITEIKNFFIMEEFRRHYAGDVFADHELIIAIDPNAGLLGSNFVIGLKNDEWCSMGALALSPNILFVLVYQKKLNKVNLVAKYTHKVWKILETDQVAKINRQTIGLGQQIRFGYVISDSEEKLQQAITSAECASPELNPKYPAKPLTLYK